MEDVVSFLPGQFPDPQLFYVELAGITWPDPEYHIRRPHSPVWCVEYVLAGSGSVTVDGRTVHPGAGDVYLLAQGADHDYRSDPHAPMHKLWFNLRGRLCGDLARSYGLQQVLLVHGYGPPREFEAFWAACRDGALSAAQRALQCSLLLHSIFARLHTLCSAAAPTGPAAAARAWLDDCVEKRVSMQQLAQAVGLSPSQLTRVFCWQYGQPPYRYLLEKKLETACLLLTDTRLSVKQIAYRLAFADEHYFSSVFRQRYGQPPGVWRRSAAGAAGQSAAAAEEQRSAPAAGTPEAGPQQTAGPKVGAYQTAPQQTAGAQSTVPKTVLLE